MRVVQGPPPGCVAEVMSHLQRQHQSPAKLHDQPPCPLAELLWGCFVPELL